MTELTIRRPDDFHVHLRDGEMLSAVLPYTANVFARALVMPNLMPPILDGDQARVYQEQIVARSIGTGFRPLMTIKILPTTTATTVLYAKRAGVVAGKVYPAGVTTNSEDGWTDIADLAEPFKAMEECGMVLCLHGESPDVFCLDREEHFVNTYLDDIAIEYPALKIVLEHISTVAAYQAVQRWKNVAGTITVHHLLLTLDDVLGGALQPHLFCKPIAKRPEDRDLIVAAATSGDQSFFFGTDSAPHSVEQKECAGGAAGIFSAPVALLLLAQFFEEQGCLERLEPFVSEFGARFYDLPLNEGTITLGKETWHVRDAYGPVTPFWSGQDISWMVRS